MSGNAEPIRAAISTAPWDYKTRNAGRDSLDALVAEKQRYETALEEIANDPDSLLLRAKQIAREALRSEQ